MPPAKGMPTQLQPRSASPTWGASIRLLPNQGARDVTPLTGRRLIEGDDAGCGCGPFARAAFSCSVKLPGRSLLNVTMTTAGFRRGGRVPRLAGGGPSKSGAGFWPGIGPAWT